MKRWRLLLAVSLAGTMLWWLHIVLTDVFPPFANAFDTALWVVCSILKFSTIIFIPVALGMVFVRCHRNGRNTATAAGIWFGAMMAILVVLSLLRAPLVAQLNNDSARFLPNTQADVAIGGYVGVDAHMQVARWQNGTIFLLEMSVITALVVILAMAGFWLGKARFWAGIAAAVSVAVLVVGASILLRLLIWDYDIFFAGTLVAPLAADVSWPYLAIDPSTGIGFLLYTVIIWTSWLLDTKLLRNGQHQSQLAE